MIIGKSTLWRSRDVTGAALMGEKLVLAVADYSMWAV
jgi:hypothetical protein